MAEYEKYEDKGYHSPCDCDADWNTPTGVLILWDLWSGDYEWEQFALLHKQQGDTHLFVAYTDSGCSCSGPYEDYPSDSWGWTPRIEEARSNLTKAISDSWSLSNEDKVEAHVSLRQFIRTLSL